MLTDLLHKFVIPDFHEMEREIFGIQKKTMDFRFRTQTTGTSGNDIRENMAKNHLFCLKKKRNQTKFNASARGLHILTVYSVIVERAMPKQAPRLSN